LDFALRASLRLFQFAPGELVFVPPKKVTKESRPDCHALRVHSAHPCASPFGQPAAVRIGWPADSSLRFSPESALAYAPSLARRRGPAIHGMSPVGSIRFGLRCSTRQTGINPTRLRHCAVGVRFAHAGKTRKF